MSYKSEVIFDSKYFKSPKELNFEQLYELFQETSSVDANQLGLGFSTLKESNFVWMTVEHEVVINKMPSLNEQLFIETYPYKSSGLNYYRQINIYDKSHNVVISNLSLWIIYDFNAKRIVARGPQYPGNDSLSELPKERCFQKIKEIGNHHVNTYIVSELDIDANHHMNNAKYLKLLGDLSNLKSLTIRYVNQALKDEVINIYELLIGNKNYITGKINDKISFQAIVERN